MKHHRKDARPGNGGDGTQKRRRRQLPPSVALLTGAMLAACSPSTTEQSSTSSGSATVFQAQDVPPSTTVEASPCSEPAAPFNEQKVTLDGRDYIEYDYLDTRVQVALRAIGGVTGPAPPPSWPIPLPSDLRERDRLQIVKEIAGGYPGGLDDMSVHLRPADVCRTYHPTEDRFETRDRLLLDLVETRADWGLALYRPPEQTSYVSGSGIGYWMPTDPAIHLSDGSPLVISCRPWSPLAGKFPHRLRCFLEIPISKRVYAQLVFRGTYLGDWRRIYELGASSVQQHVRRLE